MAGNTVLANEYSSAEKAGEGKGLVFLFQGDSVTDGNRGRNADPNHIMGHGYVFAIAARVGADFAAAGHQFYNRGISGNTVADLKKRWQQDAVDIHPDVLSILIGINDVTEMIHQANVTDAAMDQFEDTYREIIQQSKLQNPGMLLVLGLPFVYPGARVNEQWELYSDTVLKLGIRIKRLALFFDAVVVDFSVVFEKAIKKAPLQYWIWDGIHPTVPAHELMAREWIKQVSTKLVALKLYKYM